MLLSVVLFLSRPWGTGPADPAAHSAFFANLFLIQSWFHHPSDFFSFNGASWSISTEMFFYAMFPLLVWRWETTKYFKLAATAALAVACISRASHLGLSPLSDKNVLSIDAYVYIYPPARLFEFTLGIFTASIWQDSKAASFDSMKATSLQGLAALLLVCGVPILIKLYGMLFEHHIIPASAQKWLFACGSAPIFAFVIYAMALSRGLFARAISSRVLVFLGKISFSVYMTHQVIIIALTANGKLASFGPMSLQYAIYWCFVIGFSIALWVFVEKPSRRFIVYMLRRWTHRKAAEITTRVASSFGSAGPAT